jgi:hypothetical protein
MPIRTAPGRHHSNTEKTTRDKRRLARHWTGVTPTPGAARISTAQFRIKFDLIYYLLIKLDFQLKNGTELKQVLLAVRFCIFNLFCAGCAS